MAHRTPEQSPSDKGTVEPQGYISRVINKQSRREARADSKFKKQFASEYQKRMDAASREKQHGATPLASPSGLPKNMLRFEKREAQEREDASRDPRKVDRLARRLDPVGDISDAARIQARKMIRRGASEREIAKEAPRQEPFRPLRRPEARSSSRR